MSAEAGTTASPKIGCSFKLIYSTQSFKGDDMGVERLDHVQLAMPAGGEDLARAFYAEILGIPEVPKPPHLAVRGGCWFENGPLKIHLGIEQGFRAAKKAHPAFIVTDLRALIGRITDGGYRIVEDQPLEGYVRCYVDDPFGNRIELMEPKKEQQERPA